MNRLTSCICRLLLLPLVRSFIHSFMLLAHPRRAQIEEEDAALPSDQKEAAKDYEWGIVSVKAQDEECVSPGPSATTAFNPGRSNATHHRV